MIELIFTLLWLAWFLKTNNGKFYGYYDEWMVTIDALQGLTMEKMKNTHTVHACAHTCAQWLIVCYIQISNSLCIELC